MKLIIAHVPNDAWESVRTDLLDLGVLRTTLSEVHSWGPLSARTLHYRGAALSTHLRSELRLECVATNEQSDAVAGVLRGYTNTSWGFGGSVAVLDVEELHQPSAEDDVFPDDPRREATIR